MICLISLAMASELAFYPGEDDMQVVLNDPGRLTGRLLARVEDPTALEGHPDVGSLRVLAGRGDIVSITPAHGVSAIALANALHGTSGVTWAHPDLVLDLVPHALPDDPLLSEQWHLKNDGQRGFVPGVDLNAEEAWDLSTGDGTLIAVLDSGTDVDHPDLAVIDGRDYVDDDSSSDPDNNDNHGTAVAGLAAAIGNNGSGVAGVAYDADVYGIRILAEGEEEGGATIQEIFEAFVEAVDAGAAVVNNSWGTRSGCTGFELAGALREAFDYAETEGRGGLGTVNVFSAGNSGCDITGDGILAHPAVIGVAAVTGFDRRAGYSNTGPWVDISAPSNAIATTDLVGDSNSDAQVAGDADYTSSFGGTSASAPQVSGIVALMIAANPRITAAEIRRVLCDTAVRVDLGGAGYDELGWSPQYGCGRIDAGAAVRAVYDRGAPDAPVIASEAQTTPDNIVLRWPEVSDPDGDPLQYRVRWAWASAPDNEAVTLVDQPRFDLTEALGGSAGELRWRVRALDAWGAGDWSVTQSLQIAAPPVEAPGCGHAPLSLGLGLPGLVVALAWRRRRPD